MPLDPNLEGDALLTADSEGKHPFRLTDQS